MGAMAEVIKQNATLKSFSFWAHGTRIGDRSGTAIAEAIQQNMTLEFLFIGVRETQIGDITGLAIAGAIKRNITLLSFRLWADNTQIGDDTSNAMVEAMWQNTALRSFTMCAESTPISDDIQAAMAESIQQAIDRNCAIYEHRRVLLQLTTWDASSCCTSFKDVAFRCKLLEFFLPSSCTFLPLISMPSATIQKHVASTSVPSAVVAWTKDHCVEGQKHGSDQDNEPQKEDSDDSQELLDAIRRSQATAIPLSNDGVVLLRLTRMARTPEVIDTLLTSPALEQCRNRVTDAGCEVAPFGCAGAKFFVPCTTRQLDELAEAGIELMDHHILALHYDQGVIEEALKQSLPRARRPRLSPAEVSRNTIHNAQHASEQSEGLLSVGGGFEDDQLITMVEVERTFSTDSSLCFAEWSSGEAMP